MPTESPDDRRPVLQRRAVLKLAAASLGAAAGILSGCQIDNPAQGGPSIGPATPPAPDGLAGAIRRQSHPDDSPAPASTTASPITAGGDLNAGIEFADKGNASQLAVAITIDDFTYPAVVTERLAPILRDNSDLMLTVFPIGDRVPVVEAASPGFWRSMLDAGHEIGFHSMHHDDLGKKTTQELTDEVMRFNQAVGNAVGHSSFAARYGRPPYGNYGDRTQFVEVARQMGMTWVLWETVPSSADAMSPDVPAAIGPGDIALFHIRWQDMAKLPPYVKACRQRGLAMVSLRQMRLVSSP